MTGSRSLWPSTGHEDCDVIPSLEQEGPGVAEPSGATPWPSSARRGATASPRRDSWPPANDRGVALVFTLLLLGMMSLMALAMVLSSSSDMLINGYYRNARGSFYAADSGLNIARQQLLDQVIAQVPPVFTTNGCPATGGPLPCAAAATALSSVLSTYSGSNSLNAGQAAASWGEKFAVPGSSACPSTFQLATVTITSYDAHNIANGYQYIYNYSLCATGTAQGSENTSVSESGSIILSVGGQVQARSVSFAIFGGFVDIYPQCLGPLVPGYMAGPMFTNDAWEFMPGGAYIFTDPVSQAWPDAEYWIGGCVLSPTTSYTSGNQTISPTFEGNPPFALGQPNEPLPANSFSQQWAVVDGLGFGETNSAGQANNPQARIPTTAQPTNTDLNQYLKNFSGTAYPSAGTNTGVYWNYSTVNQTNVLGGGGFYVEGNANVTLSTSGASAEVIAVNQNNTTTTITIDPKASLPNTCPTTTTVPVPGTGTSNPVTLVGTTTVSSQVGSSPATTAQFCGVPMYLVPIPFQAGTMLYVDGNITSLTGTGQGAPAINDGFQMTITANGTISITGDVVYKTEPVTMADNQVVLGTNPPCCAGDPMSTLIPGHDNNQVLGIFTANGNIDLSTTYSNNNLQVDGSLAPLQQGSNWCFTCYGGPQYINTFNNVGGQIQSGICGCNMDVENTYFDRRFTSRPNFAPPWFPSTTISSTGPIPATVKPTVQHVQWLLNNMQ